MMKEGEKIENLTKMTGNTIIRNEKPNLDVLLEILNEKGKESESDDDDLEDYL